MLASETSARTSSPRKLESRRRKAKGRLTSGTFFLIPTEVLNSPAYISLSRKSRALLIDLGAQARGNNNGDISATYTMLRRRGWTSKETLSRAIAELLDRGLIQQTRQGYLGRCSLYAFTWRGIDECKGKLDVRADPVASGLWRTYKNASPTPTIGEGHPAERGKPGFSPSRSKNLP